MDLSRRPLIRCTMFGGPPTPREAAEDAPVTSLRALAALLVRGHLTEREFTTIAGRLMARAEPDETRTTPNG